MADDGEKRTDALLALVRAWPSLEGARPAAFAAITEAGAATIGVARASIWLRSSAGDTLVLEELFVATRQARPLREDQRECASGKSATADAVAATPDKPAVTPATPDKPAVTTDKPATPDKPVVTGEGGGGVSREKWAKTLKGDRKKVFLDHEEAFPKYDGDPGPKGAAKATKWRYGSETFQFKRNKLAKPKKQK